MERENLVVARGAKERVFGLRELQPDQQSFDAPD
jgi:hypothetical protein